MSSRSHSGAVAGDPPLRRAAWNELAVWMGADLRTLWGALRRHHFRVDRGRRLDCAIDLACAVVNSTLQPVQHALWAHRVEHIALPPDPLFILGHWRTGTTWLHELLALDPRHRAPTTYECFAPNHFLLTQAFLPALSRFALPRSRPFDRWEVGWDRPQEDEFALCNLGLGSIYRWLLFPNHPLPDAEYLELDELTGAKRRQWCDTWIRFLKQLLCVRGGRLVLKSPPHTFRLPHLLRIFPDARFVHLVRHPHDIYASSLRMWQAFAFAQGYQRPDPGLLPPTVLQLLERMHDRLEATRGLVPPEHWMDVPFERLIQEPLDLLRTLYARLDLGDTGPAETAWRAEIHRMRSYRAPTHSLPEQVRQAVDVHWQPYAERYGYNLGTHHA